MTSSDNSYPDYDYSDTAVSFIALIMYSRLPSLVPRNSSVKPTKLMQYDILQCKDIKLEAHVFIKTTTR